MLTYNGKERKHRLAFFHVYGIRKGPAPTQNLPAATLETAPNPMAVARGKGDAELRPLFPDGEDILLEGLCRDFCAPWSDQEPLEFERLDELGEPGEGPTYHLRSGRLAVVAGIPSFKARRRAGRECLVFGHLGDQVTTVAGVLGPQMWHGLNLRKVLWGADEAGDAATSQGSSVE